MPTSASFQIALENRTGSDNVFAYITGRALDSGSALFLLRNDGQTPYLPASPPDRQTPLAEDCAIPLGPKGSSKTVTIPHLAGARIWFSIDSKLTFLLNSGPALVEPSVSNPSDPNINLNWAFAEFTYNDAEIFANISYVDFVSIPVALTLTTKNNGTHSVAGIPADGLQQVVSKLEQQDQSDGAGWKKLVVRRKDNNAPLRALSPNTGHLIDNSIFQGYYQGYVDAVWNKYSTDTLTVNSQNPNFGTLTGKVRNGELDIGGQLFTKPSAADIFSCSTGTFEEKGSALRAVIIPRLTAAFHRSTLLLDTSIPDSPPPFYSDKTTNHYSRILHETNLDRRGYAFPYDDVSATGASDVSGAVHDSEPTLLTVTVGGGAASVSGLKTQGNEL